MSESLLWGRIHDPDQLDMSDLTAASEAAHCGRCHRIDRDYCDRCGGERCSADCICRVPGPLVPWKKSW